MAHDLQSTVGNDLVGVHVGRGTSTTLDHIHDELRVPLAADDFIASLHHSLGLILGDETKTHVGGDGSLLHHTVGLDVVGEVVQSLSRDVVAVVATHGLNTVIVISGHLERTQKIGFGTGGNSTDSDLGGSSELRRRLSKSEHLF